MEQLLFITSATIVFCWLVKVIGIISGHSMHVPIPILHVFNIEFSNTYFSTPAIAYQVYFWSNHAGLFGV